MQHDDRTLEQVQRDILAGKCRYREILRLSELFRDAQFTYFVLGAGFGALLIVLLWWIYHAL